MCFSVEEVFYATNVLYLFCSAIVKIARKSTVTPIFCLNLATTEEVAKAIQQIISVSQRR